MINVKLNCSILGSLLFIEGALLLACVAVGLFYGERDFTAFAVPIAITAVAGGVLKYVGRGAPSRMSRRDGYLVVLLTWLAFTVVGMLPLLVGGYETRVSAAFFEIMSGFTTTGATVLTNIDSLPHSVLFWRSLTHWFGGMGIVFFTLAVLPTVGMGDLKLFSAEATGMKLGKLHPRIRTTAQWLWGVYLVLTTACAVSLWLAGMGPFDAVNHAMSTTATGGFSTHQDGIAWFRSSAVEYVELAFMFVSSINFTLLYLLLIKGRLREVWRDGELRCFTLLCVGASAVIAATLYFSCGYPLERAVREAAFHVVSCQSTTGFASYDFMQWPAFTTLLILFVMAVGACAGSTTGGFKCIRLLTLVRLASGEFKRILHPHAVLPVRVGGTVITPQVWRTLIAFTTLYVLLHLASTLVLILTGLPLLDAVGFTISSFSNVGPAVGHLFTPLDAWDRLSDVGLWTCSFMMLAGRLEIFSLLLPLFPGFWRDN